MIKPALLECRDSPLLKADAGGDQIRVIAESASFGDHNLQVGPHQRFSSRKSKLCCAEFTALPQNAQPIFGRKFLAVGRVVHRVVAVHTVQWALVSDLRQQPERQISFVWFESSPFHKRLPETR